MPYTHQPSLREITDEQGGRGTTIDGNRVERAVDDTVATINAVPRGKVRTRFCEQKYVFNLMPNVAYRGTDVARIVAPSDTDDGYLAHHYPWVHVRNIYTGASQTTVTSPPTPGVQNPWTLKGINLGDTAVPNSGEFYGNAGPGSWNGDWTANTVGAASIGIPSNGYQFAWTQSWTFSSPVTIDDLTIILRTDSNGDQYDADFLDGAAGSTNVVAEMTTANPLDMERRARANIETLKWRANLSHHRATPIAVAAPPGAYTDMAVAHPGNAVAGRIFRWRDMNIPIHEGARLRLAIVIPWYVPNAHRGANTDQKGLAAEFVPATNHEGFPFTGFQVGGALTFLRELR